MTHDDIESTKAPLIEHLIELRRRLIWSLLAIFVAFLVCLYFAKPIYNLLLFPYRLAAGSRCADRDDLHRAAGILLHRGEARSVRRDLHRLSR